MAHATEHAGYTLTDDPARLDVDAIPAALSASSWSPGIPRAIVARAVANSLCIGIYDPAGAQVGLVRIISDFATFAYLCDVYVLAAHQGRGLAKVALRLLQTHPRLQGLRRMGLVTRDAHGLYRQFGFEVVAEPALHMEKPDPDVYRRGAH